MLGLDQALAMIPGKAGDDAARRMMARVWRNYFDPPSSAPAPPREWLAGIRSKPIFATRLAAIKANESQVQDVTSVPVLIMFGETDIYGRTRERLIARYPHARVVIIPGAGHIPWLQNRETFVAEISAFFAVGQTAGNPGV
jgi:pimeloyl-ACP methyl ester carboxylesterase